MQIFLLRKRGKENERKAHTQKSRYIYYNNFCLGAQHIHVRMRRNYVEWLRDMCTRLSRAS